MNCSSCGTEFEGRFCPQCGAASPEAGGTNETASASPPPGQSATQPAAGIDDNVAGALCYVLGLITGIIFLIIQPYSQSREVRFHAFQSIFMTLAFMVLMAVIGVLAVITVGLLGVLIPVVQLAGLVLWIFMLFKTYQGQKVVLPIIGPLAEKQA